jgi:hypothetical protein
MVMQYLKQETPHDQSEQDKCFLRTYLVDQMTKSFLILFEETLRSKEMIKQNQVKQLKDELQ